jgi:hypothetical protein
MELFAYKLCQHSAVTEVFSLFCPRSPRLLTSANDQIQKMTFKVFSSELHGMTGYEDLCIAAFALFQARLSFFEGSNCISSKAFIGR